MKNTPKTVVICWSCRTDLRSGNVELHMERGHKVENYAEDPRRAMLEGPEMVKEGRKLVFGVLVPRDED